MNHCRDTEDAGRDRRVNCFSTEVGSLVSCDHAINITTRACNVRGAFSDRYVCNDSANTGKYISTSPCSLATTTALQPIDCYHDTTISTCAAIVYQQADLLLCRHQQPIQHGTTQRGSRGRSARPDAIIAEETSHIRLHDHGRRAPGLLH